MGTCLREDEDLRVRRRREVEREHEDDRFAYKGGPRTRMGAQEGAPRAFTVVDCRVPERSALAFDCKEKKERLQVKFERDEGESLGETEQGDFAQESLPGW